MGECDQKTVEGILDFYYENGGNFIDTFASHLAANPALANGYIQREQLSKRRVGEMDWRVDGKARGQRTDRSRDEVYNSISKSLRREGNHCQFWRKRYQELEKFLGNEFEEPENFLH